MPERIVLFEVKQGWWKSKLTDSVIAEAPRSAVHAARVQERLAGTLQVILADGSTWALSIPRASLKGAHQIAAALGSPTT